MAASRDRRQGDRTDGPRDDDDDYEGRGGRRRRGRYRDRNRRGRRPLSPKAASPPIAEDDVLIPVAGILDLLDNYAFVRTCGYLPGPNDVYVSLSMVRQYGLRKGDADHRAVRQPARASAGRSSTRWSASTPSTAPTRRPRSSRLEFTKLTPLYPQIGCGWRPSRRSSPPGSSTSSPRSARASAA